MADGIVRTYVFQNKKANVVTANGEKYRINIFFKQETATSYTFILKNWW